VSISVKVLIEDEQGTFKRIPFKACDEARRGKRKLPKYGGRKVRIVMAYMDSAKGVPYRNIRIEYLFLKFLPDGSIDEKDERRKLQLGIDSLPYENYFGSEKGDGLSSAIAQGRNAELYRWEPTKDELKVIRELVFKK
jgi:hypothetical protein